ncbi:receptor-like protein kinase [Carex littledalei]|uniref:Receptor-like protein kinase n=1 Tax=Carex littledalei TaxID=544730 RepID=A0A833VVK0_9POAL|nr:receptor-like protein kinase [Carex littledalei]
MGCYCSFYSDTHLAHCWIRDGQLGVTDLYDGSRQVKKRGGSLGEAFNTSLVTTLEQYLLWKKATPLSSIEVFLFLLFDSLVIVYKHFVMVASCRRSDEVVDPSIEMKPSTRALKRAFLTALRCVDTDADKKPKMWRRCMYCGVAHSPIRALLSSLSSLLATKLGSIAIRRLSFLWLEMKGVATR